MLTSHEIDEINSTVSAIMNNGPGAIKSELRRILTENKEARFQHDRDQKQMEALANEIDAMRIA